MLKIFICVGYSIKTSNYSKIIALSNSTHLRNMTDTMAIYVETSRIDSEYYFDKWFIH